jgi:hypothetical protein
MTWYNIISSLGLLISSAIVICLTLKNKQYRKGKRGEIASFMMLAGISSTVGIGFNSMYSLIFYSISLFLGIIALILAIKANSAQANIK